ALGQPVGKSLCEHDLLQTAKEVISAAKVKNCTLLVPIDAVVAKELKAGAPSRTVGVNDVRADDMILDIGPSSTEGVKKAFDNAATLVWNGPLGAFEVAPFDAATTAAA